jgi:hypothetical protein
MQKRSISAATQTFREVLVPDHMKTGELARNVHYVIKTFLGRKEVPASLLSSSGLTLLLEIQSKPSMRCRTIQQACRVRLVRESPADGPAQDSWLNLTLQRVDSFDRNRKQAHRKAEATPVVIDFGSSGPCHQTTSFSRSFQARPYCSSLSWRVTNPSSVAIASLATWVTIDSYCVIPVPSMNRMLLGRHAASRHRL